MVLFFFLSMRTLQISLSKQKTLHSRHLASNQYAKKSQNIRSLYKMYRIFRREINLSTLSIFVFFTYLLKLSTIPQYDINFEKLK